MLAYVGRNQNLKDLKDLCVCAKDLKGLQWAGTHSCLLVGHLGYLWLELSCAWRSYTIMGLAEADLGSWCVCECVPDGDTQIPQLRITL